MWDEFLGKNKVAVSPSLNQLMSNVAGLICRTQACHLFDFILNNSRSFKSQENKQVKEFVNPV